MDDRVIKMPKTNSELKNNNIKRVFFAIQSSAPIQRKALQEKVGLSWGNISLNIATLINLGLVIETAGDGSFVGRKPQTLDINNNDHYLIGLDIQVSVMRAVIVDMKGRVFYQYIRSLAFTDRSSVLVDLYALIDHVLREVDNKHIVAMGVAVQGIVNRGNTTSVLFPGFSDWEQIDLKRLVEERYGITTFLFHDPDAIMCAEKLLRNARDPSLRNAALIRLENGVGLSIMINREIFTSMTGKGGELGHINVVPDGLPCSCGDRGCLEPYITSGGIIRRFLMERESGAFTTVETQDIASITFSMLATAAKQGDPLCTRLFREMGEFLGIGISSYINIINPQLIIIEGELTKFKEIFEGDMYRSINKHVWSFNETRVVFADYNPYVAAIGSALASLEKIVLSAPEFEALFDNPKTD